MQDSNDERQSVVDSQWNSNHTSQKQRRRPQKMFIKRRDRALAIVILAVDPALLGDPEDPAAVWKKLEDQFQWKSWLNKLQLRRKLFSLKLKEGQCCHYTSGWLNKFLCTWIKFLITVSCYWPHVIFLRSMMAKRSRSATPTSDSSGPSSYGYSSESKQ